MTDPTPIEPQRVAPPVQKAVKAGWHPDYPSGRMRWWDGTAWTDTYGGAIPTHRTNHALHLILSILTAGLWVPVWIIVAAANASKRR